MTSLGFQLGSDDFSATVENAARELVSAEFHNGSAFIRTPILYPSGSTVVVRVDDNGKSYFVSDFGMGYQEADLMGASLIYGRHARTIAEMAGIRFDSEAFFVIEVSREQLAGAIATIANCSQEAVALAAYKLADRRSADLAELLYDRLVRIFTPKNVLKNAPVFGASQTEYNVTALVTSDKKPAVFEAVSNHPSSIVFANSKFHDLALLETPPVSIAMVQEKGIGHLSQLVGSGCSCCRNRRFGRPNP